MGELGIEYLGGKSGLGRFGKFGKLRRVSHRFP
jgi:hypothetical protein